MYNRKFTKADFRELGDISIKLGMIYWQKSPELGTYEHEVAIIVKQQERLNRIVAQLLMREL